MKRSSATAYRVAMPPIQKLLSANRKRMRYQVDRPFSVALALSVTALLAILSFSGVGHAQGKASGDRLLNGAIDIHLHIDPMTYGADTSTLRLAKSKGVRAVVIKNHYEPTVDVGMLL